MSSICVAGLVDNNVLVYRYDARFPAKQARATAMLREGIEQDSLIIPHQALIEFVAVVSQPRAGRPHL